MADRFDDYCIQLEQVSFKLIRRLGHELSSVLAEGMSPAQFLVMRLLGQSGGMKVSEVSDFLGVTLSAVTSLSDRLASVGLVTRERDEGDRRMVWLRLTEAGRTKLAELEAKRMDLVKRYLGRLPEEDMDRLLEILGRLATIIDEED